jgi:hypothetical protein
MKIVQFIPLGVVIIALFCGIAQQIGVPVAPIGAVATFGVFLLALQLENHKLAGYLGMLGKVFDREHHA